jgi:hypothetical protein
LEPHYAMKSFRYINLTQSLYLYVYTTISMIVVEFGTDTGGTSKSD